MNEWDILTYQCSVVRDIESEIKMAALLECFFIYAGILFVKMKLYIGTAILVQLAYLGT